MISCNNSASFGRLIKVFGYNCFTHKFIDTLKMELLNIVEETNFDHDLDKIVLSMEYKFRMEKRVRRKRLDEDTVLDWKLNTGDYSCHIWEWLRPCIAKIHYLGLAPRLVVLYQLLCCSIERVFSLLKLIQEIYGGGMLEDHLKMCLF